MRSFAAFVLVNKEMPQAKLLSDSREERVMRTTLRLFLATGVAALLAACGENPLQTTGPSPLAAAPKTRHDQSGPTGGFRLAALTPYSCPSDAPRLVTVNSREDGDGVDLSWEGVPNVSRYAFEIEQLQGAIWMPAASGETYSTAADGPVYSTWRAEDGLFRMRVRNSRSGSCDELPNAQWSEWVEFRKGRNDEGPPPPEPVLEEEELVP
jgi:hypothetical protein